MGFIKREPAAFFGGIGVVGQAVIAALLAFNLVDWTDAQVGAVIAVWTAVSALLVMVIRGKVTPTDAPLDPAP